MADRMVGQQAVSYSSCLNKMSRPKVYEGSSAGHEGPELMSESL